MTEDTRCCGSGTCIIDTEGHCWCGQQWDGKKMGPAALTPAPAPIREEGSAQAGAAPAPPRS
jgi:hypothetical protein